MPLPQKPLKAVSFDSQDSSHSFRIAADRATPSSSNEPLPRDREQKLEMAGVLELCTEMLRGLLVPTAQRLAFKAMPTVALSKVLEKSDLPSAVASLVDVVSSEMQSKSLSAVQQSIQRCRHSIADQERCLASLSSRDRRHPDVVKLTRDVEEKRSALEAASRGSFRLKCEIHEAAIGVDELRRVERDVCANARRLRDVRVKYERVCDENRELNRTIQKLQGTVRVVCQIPTRRSNAYLEATNHRELTFTGQKKSKSYSVDAVVSGKPNKNNMNRTLAGLVTSVLDGAPAIASDCSMRFVGMDVMLIGMSTGKESCFSGVVGQAMDLLLSAVDDRFYHVR